MRPGNLTPNAAIVASILLHLGLVNVCQFLPSIPCNLLLGVYPLDLNKRGVWVLIYLGPLVSKNCTPDVKPDTFSLSSFNHFDWCEDEEAASVSVSVHSERNIPE